MKRIELFLALLIVVSFMGRGLSYAQSKIPKQNIPAGISSDVRKEIERLYSKKTIERLWGAYNLGRMGERAVPAISFLIGILHDWTRVEWKNGPYPYKKWTFPGYEAGIALVKIGGAAVEPLIATLKNNEDSFVRKNVAWALGEIKDKRAVEPLIAALKDKDLSIRSEAVITLCDITGQDFGVDPLKWESWWEK